VWKKDKQTADDAGVAAALATSSNGEVLNQGGIDWVTAGGNDRHSTPGEKTINWEMAMDEIFNQKSGNKNSGNQRLLTGANVEKDDLEKAKMLK
jgi:hypothetical protein